MSKKMKILMLINLAIISLLTVNVALSQAAVREWNAGDIITWGRQDKIVVNSFDFEENVGDYSEIIARDEIKYNITAIDTVQEEFDAYRTTTSGTSFINNRDYDAEDFVNDYLDLGSFINPNYSWDYVHNVTRLTSLSSTLPADYLVEPDWAVINEGFVDMLNGSEIVDTLNDPYSSVIFNFTLNDFANNASDFKIMGRGSLERGLKQFKDTTHKWTFMIDLSNVMYDSYWNGSYSIYVPYDVYKLSFDLVYSEGGILETFVQKLVFSITIDDFQQEITSESRIERGNMKSVAVNYPTIAAIGGLFAITISIVLIKKRRK